MRKLIRTILRILDGSPSMTMATRNRQRGQSMLELAFITPLLVILIVGAVEVGWYTNHWLALLEVTRVGARSGTFLQAQFDPLAWDETATIHPQIQSELMGELAPDPNATNSRLCSSGYQGFYTYIVCTMESSLEPLIFDYDDGFYDPLDADPESVEAGEPDRDLHDDIVISVFALQAVNNAKYNGFELSEDGEFNRPVYVDFQQPIAQPISPTSEIYRITYDLNSGSAAAYSTSRKYPPGLQMIVVGRFPSAANECSYTGTDKSNAVELVDGDPGYERDPFDYLDSDAGPGNVLPSSKTFGFTAPFTVFNYELAQANGNGYHDTDPEFQRGFVYTGQHRVEDPNVFCFGSEFSVADVEELINLPGFITPDLYEPTPDQFSGEPGAAQTYDKYYADLVQSQKERVFFKNHGLTLVEIFWRHTVVLRFPLFRPILDAFGDNDNIVISLWSAFPLPQVQPNIIYQLP